MDISVSPLMVYLILKLEAFSAFFGTVAWWIGAALILGIIASFAIGLYNSDQREKERKINLKGYYKKLLWWTIPLMFIASLISTCLPTTKEALMIYGIPKSVEAVNYVVNSEGGQAAVKIPAKLMQLINQELDTALSDEKPVTEKIDEVKTEDVKVTEEVKTGDKLEDTKEGTDNKLKDALDEFNKTAPALLKAIDNVKKAAGVPEQQ